MKRGRYSRREKHNFRILELLSVYPPGRRYKELLRWVQTLPEDQSIRSTRTLAKVLRELQDQRLVRKDPQKQVYQITPRGNKHFRRMQQVSHLERILEVEPDFFQEIMKIINLIPDETKQERLHELLAPFLYQSGESANLLESRGREYLRELRRKRSDDNANSH